MEEKNSKKDKVLLEKQLQETGNPKENDFVTISDLKSSQEGQEEISMKQQRNESKQKAISGNTAEGQKESSEGELSVGLTADVIEKNLSNAIDEKECMEPITMEDLLKDMDFDEVSQGITVEQMLQEEVIESMKAQEKQEEPIEAKTRHSDGKKEVLTERQKKERRIKKRERADLETLKKETNNAYVPDDLNMLDNPDEREKLISNLRNRLNWFAYSGDSDFDMEEVKAMISLLKILDPQGYKKNSIFSGSDFESFLNYCQKRNAPENAELNRLKEQEDLELEAWLEAEEALGQQNDSTKVLHFEGKARLQDQSWTDIRFESKKENITILDAWQDNKAADKENLYHEFNDIHESNNIHEFNDIQESNKIPEPNNVPEIATTLLEQHISQAPGTPTGQASSQNSQNNKNLVNSYRSAENLESAEDLNAANLPQTSNSTKKEKRKNGKLLFFRRGKGKTGIISVAAILITVLTMGTAGATYAEKDTGFLHFLKNDDKGSVIITSPSSSQTSNTGIEKYTNYDDLPMQYQVLIPEWKEPVEQLKFDQIEVFKFGNHIFFTSLYKNNDDLRVYIDVKMHYDNSIVIQNELNDSYTQLESFYWEEVEITGYEKINDDGIEHLVSFIYDNHMFNIHGSLELEELTEIAKDYYKDLIYNEQDNF